MSNRKSAILALAAAALALAPTMAQARDNNVVTPSITMDTRFDSNVRFRSTKENVDSDFILSVTPRIGFSRKGMHYGVRGDYSLTADYHTDNPDLNNISQSAALGLDVELGRHWRAGLGDRLNYYEDSLRAIGEGILVTRTDILSNTAYASLSHQHTANTGITLTARDRIEEFDNPLLVDSRTDSGELSVTHRYSETGTAFLDYSYTVYDFDTSEDNIGSHGVGIGFREAVSSSMTLGLGAGVEYTTNLGGSGSELFFTGNAALEKAFKGSYMTLTYDRAVTTPTGLADEISIRDSVNFIWDFTVTRDVSASFFTGLARNRSEPSGAVGVNSYIVEVAGNWQPYRWLMLGAGLSHYQQWPEDDFDNGLKRNKIFMNATLIGGEWRF